MEDKKHAPLPYGYYVLVWLGLLVLTGLTVTATSMNLGNLSVLAAISIALVKATAVVMIFMNLKQEPLMFKVMLLLALVTLSAIMGITFFDISYR